MAILSSKYIIWVKVPDYNTVLSIRLSYVDGSYVDDDYVD